MGGRSGAAEGQTRAQRRRYGGYMRECCAQGTYSGQRSGHGEEWDRKQHVLRGYVLTGNANGVEQRIVVSTYLVVRT